MIAVGSRTNDFGTPGVREHAIRLETTDEAARFHRQLIDACLRANAQSRPPGRGAITIAIVGGGATGVELCRRAAQHDRVLGVYGLDRVDPEPRLRIVLIEAGPRILPALPERFRQARELLNDLGIEVLDGRRVTDVAPTAS